MILVDSRIAQMVQTSRFTVGPKMKASAINPSLEGDAWELKIRKSTSLNDLIDEYNDVYLESLGVPLSTLGYQYLADVGRTMHHKAVFPAAGFTAHQANGDKSTFANIQIKLQ